MTNFSTPWSFLCQRSLTENSWNVTHQHNFTEICEPMTIYMERLLADFSTDLYYGVGFFFAFFSVCWLWWLFCFVLFFWNDDYLVKCSNTVSKTWTFCRWRNEVNAYKECSGCATSTSGPCWCCVRYFVSSLWRVLVSWAGIRDGEQNSGL